MEPPPTFFQSFDGARIAYQFLPGPKPCLTFLHGLSGDFNAWRRIAPIFHKAGHAVLLVDLRGHGYSEKNAEKYRYKLDPVLCDLELLLDNLEITKSVFLGHCFGGTVALHVAEKYPDRVSSLVLISPFLWLERRQRFFHTASVGLFSLLKVIRGKGVRYQHLDSEVWQGKFELNPWLLWRSISSTSLGTFLPFYRELAKVHPYKALKKVKECRIPLSIIQGQHDLSASPQHSLWVKQQVDHCQFFPLETNHMTIINKRESIIKLIFHCLSSPL